ncbi:MAG: DUF1727 domain-containing protein [Firmicutes bacterium]|nr:DUF1727 domain-containing protein [Bacillota bacterium]
MSIKSAAAVSLAKFFGYLSCKIRKSKGQTLPGFIAKKIDGNILSDLSQQVRGDVFAVMGTNGKTTTNALLYGLLTKEGKKVVINRTGSNMLNGVISAFVLAAGNDGKLDADFACIEADEFASGSILPKMKVNYLIITNITRDQLDRMGEVDIVYDKVLEAVKNFDGTLVINGDDVLTYSLALESGKKFVTYGIDEQVFDEASRSEIRESTFCKRCGSRLKYNFFHYGQLGDYYCEECGIKRPEMDYAAKDIKITEDEIAFTVNGKRIEIRAKANYNIYNSLSVYALLDDAGIMNDEMIKGFAEFDFRNNRENVYHIGESDIQIHLVKNPIGFQQKVALIKKDESEKDVVILINDEYQDGQDVSWLWDVNFEELRNENIKSITATGKRCLDMCLRLKYEEIECAYDFDVENVVRGHIEKKNRNVYLIVNYTGLYSSNDMLERLKKEYEEGEK